MPRARVIDGRLIVDEPTTLPEGTVLDLVVDDEGDEMNEEERAELHKHIERSWKSARQGALRPAEKILGELRESQ
jgi:hypothetical protein